MMQRICLVLLILVLSFGHVSLLTEATLQQQALPHDNRNAQVFPSALLKIVSGEFDGLTSDFLFFKVLTFYGQTFERQERPRVKTWEWQWIYRSLMVVTDLDPYFYDPYYLGAAILSWDASLYEDANILLEKGSKSRSRDWTLPYFAGFNYFYFLNNNDKAFELLKEASGRPGASPILASLASRMAIRGGRTEIAIMYLEGVLATTADGNIKDELGKRLTDLKQISLLEKSISKFVKIFKRSPKSLQELVEKRILLSLPKDPYGDEYYIDEDGNVESANGLR